MNEEYDINMLYNTTSDENEFNHSTFNLFPDQEDDSWGCPESTHASKLSNPETEPDKTHIPAPVSAVPGQNGAAQWSSKNPNQTRQIDLQPGTYCLSIDGSSPENTPSDEEGSRSPSPVTNTIPSSPASGTNLSLYLELYVESHKAAVARIEDALKQNPTDKHRYMLQLKELEEINASLSMGLELYSSVGDISALTSLLVSSKTQICTIFSCTYYPFSISV